MRYYMLLLCAVFLGCASQGPSISKAEIEQLKDRTLRAEIECGLDNISKVDDNRSDARTIALALALRCNVEYNNVTEAIAAGMDNNAQRIMIRERRAPQSRKIEDFLPIVVNYRTSGK
jgi:hypothetical protein